MTHRPPGTAASIALLLVLAAARPAAAQAAPSAALEARLDAIVTGAMAKERIPAITVAISSGGRIVYSGAFGTADLENDVPATRETLIRTASVSKPITAVAAMTLVESGKLDLDAPVQNYCAPFPPKQWPITTRELLSHTSGIRHYNDPAEMESTRHYRFMADGLAIFAGDPLLFRPGTGYQYSTYGYTVVGCAIEGAAGQPFEDYVGAHVLRPAGMTHTFVDDAFAIVPHRARGYRKVDGQIRNASLMDSSYKIPGGGYVSSAEDLVRFAQALLDDRLLKPATRAQMWNPTAVSGKQSYGLGFEVRQGGRFIVHTGGQPGTSTVLFMVPEARFALAIMANLEGAPVRDLIRPLAAELRIPSPDPLQ
jgi:serine beta-lactamase-like protein LACTB